MQLTVNPEYDKLVPNLSKIDYDNLYNSIKENGQWIPILCNKEGIVLDGHNRYDICQELGISPNCIIKTFDNKTDEIIFVGECNLKRRHLEPLQRIELVRKLEPYYEKKAKENSLSNLKQNEPTAKCFAVGRVTKVLGEKAGVSDRTYEKGIKILDNATPETIQKINNKDTSINYAYKQVNRQEKKAIAQPIPTGEFDVILADPPWTYDINTRGSPDDHYDVMSNEDIYNMKIPSSKNCVLFMWGTAPKLPEALKVIESWGFTYKTNMVWIKDKIGTGYYFRGKHELLFVAVKGNPLIPEEADRPESVLIAPRTEHSKKPNEVYDIIERMYPNGTYLELFARNNRENWTSWGLEV